MTPEQVPYAKAWLVFVLIAALGGGIVGAVIGAVLGLVLGIIGMPLRQVGIVTGGIGLVLSTPISFFTFKWVVGRYMVRPLVNRSAPESA